MEKNAQHTPTPWIEEWSMWPDSRGWNVDTLGRDGLWQFLGHFPTREEARAALAKAGA